jgi:hypothetical protein
VCIPLCTSVPRLPSSRYRRRVRDTNIFCDFTKRHKSKYNASRYYQVCCYYIQCFSFVFKAFMQPGAPPSSRCPEHRATCSRPGGVSHSAARVSDSCWPPCWPKVAISPSAMPASSSSKRRGGNYIGRGGSRNSYSKYLTFARDNPLPAPVISISMLFISLCY